jgi:hypothetical protein
MFLSCSAAGLVCVLQKWGIFVILGGALIFFANGSFYASATRYFESEMILLLSEVF